MARPAWTGTISFGMVSLPVKLFSAVKRQSVSFNQLDSESMARIRYRKVSEATDEEVPADRIVRAAKVGSEQYVVITDDELAALAPERSKEIVIDAFVPADQIDPLRFDSSFHIAPDANAKPYALLAGALGGTDRVGIGRFVMRQREHLVAIRSDGRRLQLSTLVFDDELVDPESIEEFDALDGVELSSREADMAGVLVEAMSDDASSMAFVDEYRAAVESLIEQKASGATPVLAAPTEQRGNVIDLAEALQASLEQAQAAKGRHPSTGAAEPAVTGSTSSARKKAAAKKPAASTAAAKKNSTKATAKKAAAKKPAPARQPARKSA